MTLPSAETPLSKPLFDPSSSLYAGLKSPLEKFYATAVLKDFDGWTGSPFDRVSFRWWGFERETDGPDAFVSSGYGTIIDWLEGEVLKYGGEIRLNEEVTQIETVGVLEGEGKFSFKTFVLVQY